MLSRISLVRHGQSEGNVDEDTYLITADHRINLTELGMEQSLEAGSKYRARSSLRHENDIGVFVSPYNRAKQTYMQFKKGYGDGFEEVFAPPKLDVRIREREWGDYQTYDREKVAAIKKRFGSYFYRIPNGESGADCYDRVSDFLSMVFRHDNQYGHIMLFTHGDFIKAFVMRFFHLDYGWFESNGAVDNADIVSLIKSQGVWAVVYNGEVLSTVARGYEL